MNHAGARTPRHALPLVHLTHRARSAPSLVGFPYAVRRPWSFRPFRLGRPADGGLCVSGAYLPAPFFLSFLSVLRFGGGGGSPRMGGRMNKAVATL